MAGDMVDYTEEALNFAHGANRLGAQTFGRSEGYVRGWEPDPDDDTTSFLVAMVLTLEDIVRKLSATCDELAGS